jgi:PAS domain S-box-containing protein
MISTRYSRLPFNFLFKKSAGRVSRSMATLTHEWHMHQDQPNEEECSQNISHVSPESDLSASDRFARPSTASHGGPVWSGASSDERASWSAGLSFASPEQADFTFQDREEQRSDLPESFEPFMESLSLMASPETAIGVVHYGEMLDKPDAQRNDLPDSSVESLLHSLSLLASPETATGAVHFAEMLDDSMKAQLLESMHSQESLPKTISEALADSRAVVITSAASPFDIVDVNDAWVGLCGYSREEALNRNLGDLLQGPETSADVTRNMFSRLKREHYSEAFIANYTKTGRKFQNHVKVGLLSNDEGTTTFFVGVLEEIQGEGGKVAT